jgi:class 3 adenylate cyclase
MSNIETPHGLDLRGAMLGAQVPVDEQINNMLAAPIDDRALRLAVDIVEAPADEGKAPRRQVDDRRRHVELAVERYCGAMGEAIEAAGGRVDKFTGDGVMALFGLDADGPVACRQALAAARAMSAQLVASNAALAPDLHAPLAMGIGLHFGPAIVGDMGDGRWRSLTAVGDTVNTASRLEALCKVYDCELVVSDDLLASAGVELQDARPQEVEIRGRSSPLVIHTIGSARELPFGGDETPGAKIYAA